MATPSDAIRVGLAGYGLAGAVFHAPLIEAVSGLELAAVLTRSPGRVAAARAAHPGARVVGDLEALLDGIDLLVVATPNREHVRMARAGLDRGLHVVVDKPLAATAAAARELVAERLTVFHNRRWDFDFLELREAAASGRLGELTRFESRFERLRPEIDAGAWRESADPEEGGGVLLDLGPHLIDQALLVLGPAVSVYAELAARRPGAAVDDDAFVAVEHAAGVRSHLWMSAVAPLAGPRFRVSGLRDGFAADGLDPQEERLGEGRPPDPGGYVCFYEGVVRWMRGEAGAPVDPRDAVAGLEVIEAARRSAATGRVARVAARRPGPWPLGPALAEVSAAIPLDEAGGASLAKGLLLAELVLAHDLRRVVEIGVYRGRMLLMLGLAVRELGAGTAIGIDPYSPQAAVQRDAHDRGIDLVRWPEAVDWDALHDGVLRAVRERGLGEHVTLVRETSEAAARGFADATIDLLHVDGNHDAAAVARDLELYLPKLAPGALLVLDDISWPSVRVHLERLRAVHELVLELHDAHNDFAVLRV